MTDPRRTSPAALRNRGPILEALRPHLAASGLFLEIASGTGEHVVHFASELPGWRFQPTDGDAAARDGIAAHVANAELGNVAPMLVLDVLRPWPVARADAVLCANMVHISPWATTPALMAGAAACLAPGRSLFLYGPFLQNGVETAPSNLAFDADLKRRDPAWGLRWLEDVAEEACVSGFAAPKITRLPANNLLVRFVRRGA